MTRILLAFLFTFSQIALAGPPPVSFKGQNGAKKIPAWNLVAPFSQVSDLGGINALLDTGNENLLPDPGFEAPTLALWSTGGGLNIYQTSTATEVNSGKKSLVLDEDGFSGIYAETGLFTIQKYLKGANGQISCSTFADSSTTDANYFALQVLDAAGNILVTTPLKGLNLDPPYTWTKTTANFVFPNTGATTDDQVRLRILKNVDGSTMAFDPRVDDCYLGAALNNSNGSVYIPWTNYTPTITFQSGGWTNVTIIRSEWMRDGENISIRGAATFSGASAAFSVPKITYPTGVTLQPAGVAESRVSIYTGSNLFFGVATIDTNYFSLFTHSATAGLPYASLTNTSPGTFSSGGHITWAINDVKVSQWIGSGQNVMSLNTLPNITNTATYTPSLTNFGNGTSTFTQWKSGDRMLANGALLVGATPPSGTWTYSLPSGLTIDYAKLPLASGNYVKVGTCSAWRNTTGASYTGHAYTNPAAPTNTFVCGGDGGVGIWNGTLPQTFASGTADRIFVELSVPIVGWSASVVDMPLVRNSVVTSNAGVAKTAWAIVGATCSSNPCTITSQSGDFTNIGWVSAGRYTPTWPAGTWSVNPVCTVNGGATGVGAVPAVGYVGHPASTGFDFTFQGNTNNSFAIMCVGIK